MGTGSVAAMPRRPPLPLIFAVTVTGIMANSLVSPALPDILDEFGRSDAASGVLVASGSLPGIIVAPLVGVAADRLGRKTVLVPCLLVFGVFGLAGAFAPTFELLVASRLLLGFGSAGLINLAVVMIGDNWSGADRTRMIGRNSAVLTTGLATMPLISGVLTELTSWRVAFGLYGLGIATAAAVVVLLDNHRPAQATDLRGQLRDSVELLKTPVLRTTLLSGTALFAIIFGVFLTAFPLHLEQRFGLTAGWRGAVLAVPALSSTLVSMNIAGLRQKLGLRGLLVTGSALFAAAFVAMGTTPVLALAVIAAFAYGLGEGALIPTLQDVAASVPPDHLRGGALAAWVGAARLGQSSGPLLATPLIAVGGTGATIVIGGVAAAGILATKIWGPLDDRRLAAARAD